MPDSVDFLTKRLHSEGEKMVDFFRSLTPDQWQLITYTEGAEWRIRDVMAHFVSAEQNFLRLFDDILSGGPGVSEEFSIDRFNISEVGKLQSIEPASLLDEFVAVRQAMIAWVASIQDDDLQKPGRHPFLGITTLAEMIKMIYRHNQIHYRDLRKLVEG
jgi:hypothetical protein